MDQSRSSLFIGGIILTALAAALLFGALETDWWLGARVVAGIFGLFFFSTGSYSFKKALVRFENPLLAVAAFLFFAVVSGFFLFFPSPAFLRTIFFRRLGNRNRLGDYSILVELEALSKGKPQRDNSAKC